MGAGLAFVILSAAFATLLAHAWRVKGHRATRFWEACLLQEHAATLSAQARRAYDEGLFETCLSYQERSSMCYAEARLLSGVLEEGRKLG
jgi:uncharacterized membrane protein